MVVPALDTGGMETMLAALSRGLVTAGHEVGVTCLEEEGVIADQLRADGIRLALVPTPGLRAMVRPAALQSWLEHVAPDVVHVHSGSWLKGARAARRAGVPRVVLTMHGLLEGAPWYTRFVERWAAMHADRVVAVSDTLGEYLIETVGIPPERTTVVSNGIDVGRFQPGPRDGGWRTRWRIAPDALVVGHVARLNAVKNQAQLLEAFALVVRRVPNAVLVIAGDGPLRPELLALASRLGITDAVRFIGEVRDVAPLYREFDLFVLSSTAEGTSISILEAMASGVPVAATAVGGTPALLRDGRLGRLVASRDTPALAGAITDLLLDPAARQRLARVARQDVVAQHSLERMVHAYELEYALPGAVMSPASLRLA